MICEIVNICGKKYILQFHNNGLIGPRTHFEQVYICIHPAVCTNSNIQGRFVVLLKALKGILVCLPFTQLTESSPGLLTPIFNISLY